MLKKTIFVAVACLFALLAGCAGSIEDPQQKEQSFSFNFKPTNFDVLKKFRVTCGRLVMKSLPDNQAQLRLSSGGLQNVWVVRWKPSYGALRSGEGKGDFVQAVGRWDQRTGSIYQATITRVASCSK